MREINLQEYEPSEHLLSVAERDLLLSHSEPDTEEARLSLTIEPIRGAEGAYSIRPGATVGAIEIGDLSVFIEPKIGIPHLLSLACYAMGVFKPQETRLFDFCEEETLPDTLALALASAARRAFARGLLHDYRSEQEALYTVRGRIRFDEQIRRRFGVPLPIEVEYDEFTDDILANQLVKAAAARLSGMRLRSPSARKDLGWIAGMLENVSPIEFHPNNVPNVAFNRLNDHYRGVVGLSRLILRHSAFESGRGQIRATGFLMNMNSLFQEFVTQALREALGVSDRVLRSDNNMPNRVYLDYTDRIRLKPDLSWWEGRECRFVGDAKYKRIPHSHVPNADLYQMLAYSTALDLPGGLLIYAKDDESAETTHHVRHSDKRIEVAALDLSGTLDAVLARVNDLADRVRKFRDEARELERAA